RRQRKGTIQKRQPALGRPNSDGIHKDPSLFFQAEDGIRVLTVTRVQTCALLIFLRRRSVMSSCAPGSPDCPRMNACCWWPMTRRSEERRVGKEGGGWGAGGPWERVYGVWEVGGH